MPIVFDGVWRESSNEDSAICDSRERFVASRVGINLLGVRLPAPTCRDEKPLFIGERLGCFHETKNTARSKAASLARVRRRAPRVGS